MTTPTDQQLDDDRAVQVLSDEGAQCGNCGDEPGERWCSDCEECRARYVAALRATGWAPQPEHEALVAEVRRLRAELEGPAAESDTLPAWLYSRFINALDADAWNLLTDADRAYWEHQARAVRRAVARDGFKAVAPDAASVPPGEPVAASPASGVSDVRAESYGAPTGPRRTLTPVEYDAAWHAVEGAAGDEGADPGTVLHAVLDRLGIDGPAPAAR